RHLRRPAKQSEQLRRVRGVLRVRSTVQRRAGLVPVGVHGVQRYVRQHRHPPRPLRGLRQGLGQPPGLRPAPPLQQPTRPPPPAGAGVPTSRQTAPTAGHAATPVPTARRHATTGCAAAPLDRPSAERLASTRARTLSTVAAVATPAAALSCALPACAGVLPIR